MASAGVPDVNAGPGFFTFLFWAIVFGVPLYYLDKWGFVDARQVGRGIVYALGNLIIGGFEMAADLARSLR